MKHFMITLLTVAFLNGGIHASEVPTGAESVDETFIVDDTFISEMHKLVDTNPLDALLLLYNKRINRDSDLLVIDEGEKALIFNAIENKVHRCLEETAEETPFLDSLLSILNEVFVPENAEEALDIYEKLKPLLPGVHEEHTSARNHAKIFLKSIQNSEGISEKTRDRAKDLRIQLRPYEEDCDLKEEMLKAYYGFTHPHK